MPAPTPFGPDVSAERIGPYRLVRPISAGGMARVYEGRFDSLAGVSTRVAIKVIHPDFANESGFRDLFIQEARISARLEHQNLVRVQQFNREGELYYLVMEYIDGVTFRKVVTAYKKHGLRVPPNLLAEMARQVCDGLAYAHELASETGAPLSLVHRDIKPSNLMINTQGVAKVLDFGISYATGADEARGSVKGTWGYMAPEQAHGERVGPAADLYGLAVVLYEVASLEPLFPETDNAQLSRLLLQDEGARRAAALGGAYLDLSSVLVRALHRDPAARFQSAAAMGKALAALVADPMGARDNLVRLVGDLKRLEAQGPSPQAEGLAVSVPSGVSAKSISTIHPPAPGLPVVTGTSHGPRRPVRANPGVRRVSVLNTVLSLGFAAVAVAVLVFTTYKLYLQPATAPKRPSAESVVAAPVVSATPALRTEPDVASVGEISGVEPAPLADLGPAPDVGAASGAASPVAVSPAAVPVAAVPVAAVPAAKSSAGVVSTGAPKSAPAPTRPAQGTSPRETPRTADLVAALDQPKSPATAAPAAADAAVGEGSLSLGSTPKAQVMIDGAYVRYTPIFQYNLASGSHSVVLVADDGRRKSFRVDVVAGQEARRIWLFDEDRWADGAASVPAQ